MARRKALTKEEHAALMDRTIRATLTPHRTVVRETSRDRGLRVLTLSCGHTCTTRGSGVYLTVACLSCVDETEIT